MPIEGETSIGCYGNEWYMGKAMSIDRDGANVVKENILDDHFWSQIRYVFQFTQPIYQMIKFVDFDQPIIGEVYEQMNSILGHIKDIVEPIYVNLYNYICADVEKWWEMLNIPLHALGYVLTPKYYHASWISSLAPRGGTKASYMKALD